MITVKHPRDIAFRTCDGQGGCSARWAQTHKALRAHSSLERAGQAAEAILRHSATRSFVLHGPGSGGYRLVAHLDHDRRRVREVEILRLSALPVVRR